MNKLIVLAAILLSGCVGIVYALQNVILNAKEQNVNVITHGVNEQRPIEPYTVEIHP